MCEIVPGKVYLGTTITARNIKWLEKKNIKKIINLSNVGNEKLENYTNKENPIEELEIKLRDNGLEVILDVIEVVDKFVGGGDHLPVLYHCFAGESRSVSLVIAYLMKNMKMPFWDALVLIEKKKPKFLSQLEDYQNKLIEQGILKKENISKRHCSLVHHYFCMKFFHLKTKRKSRDMTSLEKEFTDENGVWITTFEEYLKSDDASHHEYVLKSSGGLNALGIAFSDVHREWKKNKRKLVVKRFVYPLVEKKKKKKKVQKKGILYFTRRKKRKEPA